ncbi:MAG: HRDC domain-containing protein [Pirellulaceae bacterium]
MQFKVFSIPASGDEGAEEELNRFLRSHRSISVHKELVQGHSGAYWSFCIEYIVSPTGSNQKGGGRRRVDYKELLSESDFAVFAQLRDARKRLADQEAIPVYAVCTNEQLAEVAKGRPASLSDLKAIEGLGDAKVEKYGESLLAVVREHGLGNSEAKDEKGGETS